MDILGFGQYCYLRAYFFCVKFNIYLCLIYKIINNSTQSYKHKKSVLESSIFDSCLRCVVPCTNNSLFCSL